MKIITIKNLQNAVIAEYFCVKYLIRSVGDKIVISIYSKECGEFNPSGPFKEIIIPDKDAYVVLEEI